MDRFVTTAFSPPTSRPGSDMNESDAEFMDPGPQPGSSQGEFLTIVPEAVKKFYASSKSMGKLMCMTCNKEISFDPRSNKSNFGLKSHYERKHRGAFSALKAVLEGSSKRGRSLSASSTHSNSPCKTKKLYQSSIEASFEPKFNQQKTLMLYYDLFIGNIMPFHITDSPQMKALMQQLNREFKPPSRRKMSRDINWLGDKAKETMITLLSDVSHVATTADSWSAHNRGFLGMTVHWIDTTNLKRDKAVLGVKEIVVRQEAAYLSRAMMDLHEDFSLSQKVVSTTTDNGRNYVAAFADFAGRGEGGEEVGPLLHPDGDDEEEEDDDFATVLVGDSLTAEEGLAHMPKHRRCAAHTVNLMATTDISDVPGWNSGNRAPFTKLAAKAQGLWNCQNRRTVAANLIKTAVGKKLPTPGATRWNSYYDSCEALLKVLNDNEKKENLGAVMRGQDLPTFTELDRELLAEYVKILKPVARCLDTLQSDDMAHMGILLPYLMLMKDALESFNTDATITHGKKLVEYLLDNPKKRAVAFNGRFGHMFADEDLLMAVALHPHYKLGVVAYINLDLEGTIKRRGIREVNANVCEHNGNGNNDAPVQDRPGTFEYMKASMRSLPQTNLDEELEKNLDSWTKLDVQDNVPLSPDMFPMEHRQSWVSLFIRYNTPVPSSAAVERLFSMGSDVMRPKRSRLTGKNFEKLLFLKGNMNLLKSRCELEDSDEEE